MAAKTEKIENKAAEPKLATTEQGEAQLEEEAKLTKAATKRQQELAQSGYRLPRTFFAGETDQLKKEEKIAAQQAERRKAAQG